LSISTLLAAFNLLISRRVCGSGVALEVISLCTQSVRGSPMALLKLSQAAGGW
jgi:hypothetical protein